jgi:hypothetical protein
MPTPTTPADTSGPSSNPTPGAGSEPHTSSPTPMDLGSTG